MWYNRRVMKNNILKHREEITPMSKNTNKINETERRCGTCIWFEGEDDDSNLQFCDEKEMWCYNWGICPHWEQKTN